MKFNYSYLVIAKPTMLDNEYTNIKALFKEFKKFNNENLTLIVIKIIKTYQFLLSPLFGRSCSIYLLVLNIVLKL